MLPPSECARALGSAGARNIIASFLLGTVDRLHAALLAGMEFAQLSAVKVLS
jgi:hypothetical protein